MDFQGWCGLQNEEKHAHHTTIHENITILLVLHRKKMASNTTIIRQILKTDRNQIAHIFWHTSVLFLATTMTLFHGLEL